MEFARLDATAFPHIFELVLAHAPDELLLRVRLVNRASQTFVDRLLFEHVAFTHKGGPVYTPGLTLPDPPPVVYAYSLSSRSFSSRRLPLPALVVGTGGKLIVPPHPGWAHTRVLDLETAMRTFGSHIEEPVEFPVLHTVRRRAWIFEQKSAHTLVDVLRVPLPWKHDKAIHPLAPGVERHVLLVLYDPTWDGVTSRIGFHSPWSPWDLSSHAVIIFRPCPRDERVTHSHLIKEPTGRTGTFLHFFFCLVTNRYRGSYTFVGLENVPTHILAKELDLSSDDLLLAAAHQSTGDNEHWARVVAVRTIEAIRAIPSDDQEFLEVDDIVEVLTMDEYRAREGEDVWVRETFGDALPALL